jgi:flagellar motor switch/type III secretory pathway protein FliN
MGKGDQVRIDESAPSPPDLWAEVLDLSCRLNVSFEIPEFTIRDLLSLQVDSIVDTQRREGAHVPVVVNGGMVAWAEFDVIEDRLAVRLTEMV